MGLAELQTQSRSRSSNRFAGQRKLKCNSTTGEWPGLARKMHPHPKGVQLGSTHVDESWKQED